MSIKSFLKRILPASYKKIDSNKTELLESIEKLNNSILIIQNEIKELKQTVENETNWKRADIVNDIKPILSELKQTVENESNWKRADIVNDLRPILSELKQTVENESNWKRHDIQKAMEESQYRIKNIEKMISINFYENLKKAIVDLNKNEGFFQTFALMKKRFGKKHALSYLGMRFHLFSLI